MDEQFEMKDHYDFRGAERGKFYRPLEQLKVPVDLDTEDGAIPLQPRTPVNNRCRIRPGPGQSILTPGQLRGVCFGGGPERVPGTGFK